VPGGTQAPSRTEKVTVLHEGRTGTISRPTLLVGIVGKAAATALPGPERHYRDLALLCALVGDPFELVDQMTRKDRQRLRLASSPRRLAVLGHHVGDSRLIGGSPASAVWRR
jgi:hypothetical protein